ncbi:MAG TPA: phosphatase PAP2 family protein, partial [Burkholderiales bacterium]|nr:phosphatase PAP2 family protein [Burkholderiales bacterium]
YGLTSARSDRTLWFEPAPLPNENLKVADQRVQHVEKDTGPSAYTRVTPKTPATPWERPGSLNELRLAESLYAQNFRNIKVAYDTTNRLLITASNDDLEPASRAIGRAARTALLQAPLETRGIDVTLLRGASPQVRYEFFDVERLQRYFDGEIKPEELNPYVKVTWINPAARQRDPLARLDDLNPEAQPRILSAVVPDTFSVSRLANDVVGAGQQAAKVDWLRAGALGASLVLTSSLLDKRAERFAEDHANNRWVKNGVKLGNAIPWLALGGAGLAAIDGSDPRRSRTGYAALEAGGTALALTQGLKYAFGRARPSTGLSNTTFSPGARTDDYWSFPSAHSVVAWSVLTPFAMEYDMPWLYGVAGLTNLARIGSRQHWVSDTVASSLLGYGLGRLFWQSSREQAKGDPKVYFDGSGMSMLWDW